SPVHSTPLTRPYFVFTIPLDISTSSLFIFILTLKIQSINSDLARIPAEIGIDYGFGKHILF
ncbi:MAG: hypothetical protein LUH07_00775, partial [Lachnospiraceae bacterium]|nr:hypothetical protein [Lachnospiraceae bacterium]